MAFVKQREANFSIKAANSINGIFIFLLKSVLKLCKTQTAALY